MAMLSTQFFHRTEGSKVRNDLQPRWNLRPMALIARVVSAVQSELRARRDLAELASLDDRRSATSASAEAKFTVWCGGRLSVPKMRTQAGGCAITKV
jgi:hypothetical protein